MPPHFCCCCCCCCCCRFADNPYVVHGGIRFYAGSPLVNSRGHRLGTL
jgi:hypothetical protein